MLFLFQPGRYRCRYLRSGDGKTGFHDSVVQKETRRYMSRSRLERDIQREIINRYTKGGKASFIEVKRPGERPRPLQEYRIKELRALGFEVEILSE